MAATLTRSDTQRESLETQMATMHLTSLDIDAKRNYDAYGMARGPRRRMSDLSSVQDRERSVSDASSVSGLSLTDCETIYSACATPLCSASPTAPPSRPSTESETELEESTTPFDDSETEDGFPDPQHTPASLQIELDQMYSDLFRMKMQIWTLRAHCRSADCNQRQIVPRRHGGVRRSLDVKERLTTISQNNSGIRKTVRPRRF